MTSRREFMLVAVPATLAVGLATRASAQAPAKVPENDPTAVALGFRLDATKVDTAKFKQYVKGSTCANCNLYAATKGKPEGACSALANRIVPEKGWCIAWVKKA